MKKKLVAVLMTAAMVCSMGSVSAVSVFAEEETAEAAGDEDVVYVDPLEAEDGLPFAATELSKGKTIGVSVQTHANAFFLAEIDGVKATLEKGGIDAEVINIHTIKPLDEDLIVASAKKTGKVVTVEEHSVIGGLGGAVAECLSEKAPTRMLRIGMNDVFGESGTAVALLHKYGLDAEGIYNKIKAFV